MRTATETLRLAGDVAPLPRRLESRRGEGPPSWATFGKTLAHAFRSSKGADFAEGRDSPHRPKSLGRLPSTHRLRSRASFIVHRRRSTSASHEQSRRIDTDGEISRAAKSAELRNQQSRRIDTD